MEHRIISEFEICEEAMQNSDKVRDKVEDKVGDGDKSSKGF